MLHNQWLLTMLDSGYEERRCCAHEKMQVELLSCWVAVQGMIFKKGGCQRVSGGHHCNIRVLTEIQPEIGLGRGFVSLVVIKCNQYEYKSQSEESHEDKSQSWKEVGFWKEGQLKARLICAIIVKTHLSRQATWGITRKEFTAEVGCGEGASYCQLRVRLVSQGGRDVTNIFSCHQHCPNIYLHTEQIFASRLAKNSSNFVSNEQFCWRSNTKYIVSSFASNFFGLIVRIFVHLVLRSLNIDWTNRQTGLL